MQFVWICCWSVFIPSWSISAPRTINFFLQTHKSSMDFLNALLETSTITLPKINMTEDLRMHVKTISKLLLCCQSSKCQWYFAYIRINYADMQHVDSRLAALHELYVGNCFKIAVWNVKWADLWSKNNAAKQPNSQLMQTVSCN